MSKIPLGRPRKSQAPANPSVQPLNPGLATVQNENEFCDRLADAMPGDVIPYHVGLLAADRSPPSKALTEIQRIELNALADRAMQMAETGVVYLVQRRIGRERFVYLAIVRTPPLQMSPVKRAVLAPVQRRSAAA